MKSIFVEGSRLIIHNRPIINRTMLVSSFFEEGDTVILRELQ